MKKPGSESGAGSGSVLTQNAGSGSVFSSIRIRNTRPYAPLFTLENFSFTRSSKKDAFFPRLLKIWRIQAQLSAKNDLITTYELVWDMFQCAEDFFTIVGSHLFWMIWAEGEVRRPRKRGRSWSCRKGLKTRSEHLSYRQCCVSEPTLFGSGSDLNLNFFLKI